VIPTNLNPIQQVAAATAGGILTALFVTPFDVVKTRLQAQLGSSQGQRFKGTLDAFWKIGRHEGFTALWRGLPVALVLTVPATAFYFTSYERFKRRLDELVSPKFSPPLSGLGARTLTVIVSCPLELLRTNIQSHAKIASVSDALVPALRELIKQKGWLGLWTGLGPTLWRDAPFSIIYWTGFESIRAFILRKKWKEGFLVNFLSGLAAGLVAAATTTPIDVIKTRQQMHHFGEYPSGAFAIMRRVWAEEGAWAFFSGITPRLVKVAPACAIMISSYELFKKFIYVGRSSC